VKPDEARELIWLVPTKVFAIAMAGRLWLKSADGIAAWETAVSIALHWASLVGACCSVKPDEARD
jgi:S-methylmethionine-dependent homocysteine/selenocysteine methylase